MTSKPRYDAGGELILVEDHIAVQYAGGTPFSMLRKRFEGLPRTPPGRDDESLKATIPEA